MRKLPIYLLLDWSGDGDEIKEAMKMGSHGLLSELKSNPHALETVWVSVWTFAASPFQVLPLTDLINVPKDLPFPDDHSQDGFLGKAMKALLDAIKGDFRPSTPERKGDWEPLVFVFIDGQPNDDSEDSFLRALQDYNYQRVDSPELGLPEIHMTIIHGPGFLPDGRHLPIGGAYEVPADICLLPFNKLSPGEIGMRCRWNSPPIHSPAQVSNEIKEHNVTHPNLPPPPPPLLIMPSQEIEKSKEDIAIEKSFLRVRHPYGQLIEFDRNSKTNCYGGYHLNSSDKQWSFFIPEETDVIKKKYRWTKFNNYRKFLEEHDGVSYKFLLDDFFKWPVFIEVPIIGFLERLYPIEMKSRRTLLKFHTVKKLRGHLKDDKLNVFAHMKLALQLSRALRILHQNDLWLDVSTTNVIIDPDNLNAIICEIRDSLSFPGSEAELLGSPGYIAPEVYSTLNLPLDDPKRVHNSPNANAHSLAVIIYEMLFLRHPLRGPKIFFQSSAEEDDFLALGPQALFIEHPNDASNRPENLEVPFYALGPWLEKLFLQAFVEGLHQPEKRPTAWDWEAGLRQTVWYFEKEAKVPEVFHALFGNPPDRPLPPPSIVVIP
ncbi:MAG: hypothetical protein C4567_04525 [Deltaproteobacteria bacterium]|nr:MAG: hypothetical protein C4567_04525 [Deltaproteobacteria bacterium]